ncbi:hypothetical protein R1flu_015818 [Riccia fluitans]|uniref:Auxin efflux carrier component n=1 Tax=Riccia fluitans TaxID=41844 RepID=A0ABD1YNY0_9MARC
MGLGGSEVISLVNAIVPLYISIALGYSLPKLKVLTHKDHYAGIVAFRFKVTTPPLVFQLVAGNDPYALNLRLIAADTLCKVLVLLVLSFGCFWRPRAKRAAWLFAYFNLATMSSTVLVGIPLFTALYPGTEKDLTAIIFMQCLLWFGICIFILEVHKVLLEKDSNSKKEKELELDGGDSNALKDGRLTLSQEQSFSSGHTGDERRRSSSFGQGKIGCEEFEEPAAAATTSVAVSKVATENGSHHVHLDVVPDSYGSKDVAVGDASSSLGEDRWNLSKFGLAKGVLKTVALNFICSPPVWASLFGFLYALLNFKFNHGNPLPAILKTSVSLLANCSLGMAMFMLGMNMAAQEKLLPCGLYEALRGAAIRFFVSPAVMAVASVITGLRGQMFRFAVLQVSPTIPSLK